MKSNSTKVTLIARAKSAVTTRSKFDIKWTLCYNRILDSNEMEQKMELSIKAGDTIRYTSALGSRLALVRSITIGPTAKLNHSIPWMHLTVYGINDQLDSKIYIPADTDSLRQFKVEMA
jgi:hypothetical protein